MNKNNKSKSNKSSSRVQNKKEEKRKGKKEHSHSKKGNDEHSSKKNEKYSSKHRDKYSSKHSKYKRRGDDHDSSSENSDNQYINELSHRAIKYDNKCSGSRWKKRREYKKRHANINSYRSGSSSNSSNSSSSSNSSRSSGSHSSSSISGSSSSISSSEDNSGRENKNNYFKPVRKDSFKWGCLEISTKDNIEFISDNFIATKPSHVSVHIGDHVQVLDKPKKGWWYVQKLSGEKGMIPINCVVAEISSSLPKRLVKFLHLLNDSSSESSEEEVFDYRKIHTMEDIIAQVMEK